MCCDIKCIQGDKWVNGLVDRYPETGDRILTGPKPDTLLTPDEYFNTFAPIFSNTDVNPSEIGETMLEHMKKFNIPMNSRRLLVGGLSGKK